MLRMISGGRCCQPAGAKAKFPDRGLHAVDIENLAGAALPSLAQVREVQGLYAECLALGALDQVVIASSHLTLLNAAHGWPHARYRVRSGPDGADLELLDVLLCENVAARFAHVVIGSGDGAFARAAASLTAAGVWITVVSRRRSLSPQLALVADEVIYLDALQPVTAAICPPDLKAA
jgi:NYN domain